MFFSSLFLSLSLSLHVINFSFAVLVRYVCITSSCVVVVIGYYQYSVIKGRKTKPLAYLPAQAPIGP
jgi:hypothetical protein